jgi:hypothetical protein
MIPLVVVLGAVAAFLLLQVAALKVDSPFTLAELTASRQGISNTLPAAFLLRARGLGVLAGQLRDAGFVVTSAFRSRALDDVVLADNAARGIPNLGTPGPGPHSECRGLDVVKGSASPSQVATALRATTPGQLASQIVVESNHVHLTFDVSDLEEVGAVFVAANPLFDVAGSASVVQGATDEVVADVRNALPGVFGAGQSTEESSSGIVFGVGDIIPAGVDPSTVGIVAGAFASPLPDGSHVVESF